jgi:hypothetical protein
MQFSYLAKNYSSSAGSKAHSLRKLPIPLSGLLAAWHPQRL